MTQEEQKPIYKEFKPERDNPCWDCKYRMKNQPDYTNICLLDDKENCVREA